MKAGAEMRAFVVDDEPVIALTLEAILRLHGFSVRSFTDPFEALAAARVEAPGILLSDVVMPGLSGVELAVQIRALCPDCRVFLLSGQAGFVDFLNGVEGLEKGLFVIAKPVHPNRLMAIIRNELRGD